MVVKLIISLIILLRIFVYYFNDELTDIYSNFGLYFPFVNLTTYKDLANYVIIPLFLKTSDQTEEAPTLFTQDELQKYDGKNANFLYLAILGNVFDVTSGISYYGIGKVYHGFVGRDASRAFISGEFNEETLSDHVLDLPAADLLGLKDWVKMYESKYIYKGKLIGRYFDDAGEPTKYSQLLESKIQKALLSKASDSDERQKFPPCNVEWTKEKGSRVWCSTRSGGIERPWIGVPRKLYIPGSKSYRCACVNIASENEPNEEENHYSKYFSEYEDCDINSHSCYVKL